MKTLAKLLAEKGIADPATAAETARKYYEELLPEPIGKQLKDLEEGKDFNYKPVVRERLEHMKGDMDDFLEEFSEDSEKIIKELGGKAKESYKEAKGYFSDFFNKKKEKETKKDEGDDIKKAKEELDKE